MPHWVEHLGHFFSSLLSSKEFWAACLGAVIGGLLTGWFALFAQKQAAKDQRQRDEEAERRALNGTLRAIAAELKVIKADNLDPLDERVKTQTINRERALETGSALPPPMAMTHTEPNRGTVFESNAGMLGKIGDNQLREKIISVYGHVKGLIDQMNAMGSEFLRWHALEDADPKKRVIESSLYSLETGLASGLGNLQRELDEVIKNIESYLDRSATSAAAD